MRSAFFKTMATCCFSILMLQVVAVCSPVAASIQSDDCSIAAENLRRELNNIRNTSASDLDLQDVLQRLKQITDTCPNLADAWYFRGMVEKKLGQSPEYSLGKARQFKSEAFRANVDPFSSNATNDNPVRPSAANNKETNKPKIEIHYPKPTRGQSAQVKTCNVIVEGQAIDESDIREVLVHNVRANVGEQGKFSASLNLKPGNNSVEVSATDIHGNTAQETFTIACENVVAANPPQPIPQNSSSSSLPLPSVVMAAKQYALAIGINNYQNLSKLETAVNDAKDVARVLREEFGFEVKLLLDAEATREKIMDALQAYEQLLKAGDRLLIYYAGHGYKDTTVNKAYWNPVNATSSRSSWISSDDVTTSLRGIKLAQQILIVSDSCYSGELARSYDLRPTAPATSPTERNNFLTRTSKEKSRILIASGGNEPVADGGGGKHSLFAAKFLLGLRELNLKAFTVSELFDSYIKVSVGGNSDQLPRMGPLMAAEHDGGEFIFVRQK